jgi:hypothetical protein
MNENNRTNKRTTGGNYERADYGRIGKENLSTLTVKLPRELRQFWQIQCKIRNQSLSFLITQLLEKELGKPEESSVIV